MEKITLSNKRSAGFTLVEIMVAILILGLAIGGFFAAFILQARFSIQPTHKTIAMNYAQQTLEGLRNAVSTYYDTSSDHGYNLFNASQVGVDIDPGVNITGGGRLPEGATMTYRVTNLDLDSDWDSDGIDTDNDPLTPGAADDVDAKQVKVTVTWPEE